MQENRSITPGLGAFRLTLQSRENGFCGYVYSAALGCRAEFTSLARLIVLLEEWMNTATDSPVPEKPSAAAAPADVELEVRLRQHYSWQGQLRDLKGGAVFPFLQGALTDALGSWRWSWMLVFLCELVMLAYALAGSRVRKEDLLEGTD